MSLRFSPANSTSAAAPASGQRWLFQALISAVSAVVLVACGGGGGGDAATGSAGTGSSTGSGTSSTVAGALAYTSGTITGFGSIIVNGVRYDETGAELLDDSGRRSTASALSLGTTVDIDSGAVDASSGKAKALRIRLGGGLLGPVGSVDSAASSFVLLGQTVLVDSTTVFDSSLAGGLSALTAGAVVGIHGQWDASRSLWVASRVESKTGATAYRAKGVVSALDTTARTFTLGGATLVSYGASTTLPTGFADGVKVGVALQTTPVDGRWVADLVFGGEHKVPDMSDTRLHGLITAFTSATAFTVGSTVVDASAASFPDGQTGVVLGADVEVHGKTVNGVLVATEVSLDDHGRSGHGSHGGPRFELHGAITAVDTTAFTFTLRGVTVSYDDTLEWVGLTETGLAVGVKVEVRGQLSADRTTLVATRISLDN